jgi:chemotaxis response regulator CheB
MDNVIRVVVANQPRLMRELVLETINEQSGIEIVGEIKDESAIAETVDATQPDCLIITLYEPDQRPPLCDILLRRYPEMKILAVAPERNSGMCFWASFDIHESPAESSEAGILKALRHKGQQLSGGA